MKTRPLCGHFKAEFLVISVESMINIYVEKVVCTPFMLQENIKYIKNGQCFDPMGSSSGIERSERNG